MYVVEIVNGKNNLLQVILRMLPSCSLAGHLNLWIEQNSKCSQRDLEGFSLILPREFGRTIDCRICFRLYDLSLRVRRPVYRRFRIRERPFRNRVADG